MAMHAAKIEDSPRLQKVLKYLRFHGVRTTMEIIQDCHVCAVNSIIAELRANNFTIDCQAVKGQRGVYQYRLIEGQQPGLFGAL